MNITIANSLFDRIAEARMGMALTVEEVRVGYFSSCMRLNSGEWRCGLEIEDFRNVSDPLDLAGAAENFRRKTISPGLM